MNEVHKLPNNQWEPRIDYDNSEFSLATGQTDYDVATNQTYAWNNVTVAKYMTIRTDQTITIKLNSDSNDAITVTSSDSPYVFDYEKLGLEITNVYITNASGSTAAIKIFLC